MNSLIRVAKPLGEATTQHHRFSAYMSLAMRGGARSQYTELVGYRSLIFTL
jgi:hypothetical protein